ncbi:MAG: DUF3945 domain-containing protein [Porphyromonas sp.]|uniref:DUF3945 domain-containing protein n=1 Tax=Porphyromonas sp. TaxID=1924944 RepID=UPI002A810E28|nr:DUF3945 domain-containing protein [Porphyromonas sp.]MDY4245613.1 DUF3945 domain-containing protein [Porphyromonas sp.]
MSTIEYDNKEFEVSLDAAPKLGERTITHKDASGESVTSTYLADYEYRFKSLGLVYTPASEDSRATIGIVKNDENTLGRNWLQSKLSNTNERLGEAYSSEPSDRVLEKIADDIILYYSANGTSLSPSPHDVTLDKDVLVSDLRDFYSKSYDPDSQWLSVNDESQQSLDALGDYLYQQEMASASQVLTSFQQQYGSNVSQQASTGGTPEESSDTMSVDLYAVGFPGYYESVLYNSEMLSDDDVRDEYRHLVDFELSDDEVERLVDNFQLDGYKEATSVAYMDTYLDAVSQAYPDLIEKKTSDRPVLDSPREYNYRTDYLYQPIEISKSKLGELRDECLSDPKFLKEYPDFPTHVSSDNLAGLGSEAISDLIYFGTNKYLIEQDICETGLTDHCLYGVSDKGVDIFNYVDADRLVLDSIIAEHTGITEDLSDDNDSQYILVAEDRSQVSFGDDVGDMQVVRSIADDGSIDGVSVSDLTDDTAQAVPKFEKEPSGQSAKAGKSGKPKPTIDKDYDIPILEPFLRNFVRFARYGDYRLWLVPVLSQGIKGISAGIDNLRQALHDPKNNVEYIKDSRVRPQDYLEEAKVTDELESKLASLGLSKQILEERGQLENLLSFKPTDLLPVRIKTGDIDVKTEGRLTLRTQPDGSESISVRCVRKELNLETPYMCCSFTDQDKQSLLETGHLGRVAQLKGADGREFSAYISVDEDTNTLVYVPTARVYIPQTISGVDLSPDQRASLRAGEPLSFSGVSAKGKEYTATIQVDACKRAMSFTFPTNDVKQVLGTRRADGVPTMLNGQVLTKEAQDKLAKGETLYLEGLKNSRTKKSFNSYVSYDASTQRVRYSKYDPTDLTKQAQKREVRLVPNDKDAPKQKQSKGRKV